MKGLKKGFTLIELLIVIVIIGILAGIVVGIVGTSANKKAQDAKLKATVHEVQNAIEQYYMNQPTNAYPAEATWKADLVGNGVLTDNTNTTDLTYEAPCATPTNVTAAYCLFFTLKNTAETGDSIVDGLYYATSKQE